MVGKGKADELAKLGAKKHDVPVAQIPEYTTRFNSTRLMLEWLSEVARRTLRPRFPANTSKRKGLHFD